MTEYVPTGLWRRMKTPIEFMTQPHLRIWQSGTVLFFFPQLKSTKHYYISLLTQSNMLSRVNVAWHDNTFMTQAEVVVIII